MPRPSGGSGNPTVTKGTLTILQGANSIFTKTFMFNPNDVDDTKATSYGSIEVPGASHPIYQYGAGGERLITFGLYIDGDRGRIIGQGTSIQAGLDITKELNFYRSFVYPTNFNDTFTSVFPPMGIFNMGPYFSNVRVIIKKADPKITYWTPKMEPVRATIAMALAEIPQQSVLASDLLQGYLT